MATEIVELEKQEIEGMQSESSAAIERARQLAREIKDGTSLDAAAQMMLAAKRRIKTIKERFAGTTENPGPKTLANLAWKKLVEMESQLIEPNERVEAILKPAMTQFTTEQDRKRRQEEDRLRAEARKREEDARVAAAAELERSGDHQLAESVLDTPVEVAPVILPAVEQSKGISYRDAWKYRIVDESKVPREYLCLDERKIGGVVRSLKGDAKIPGVEIYSEKTVAGRI